ncbi:MAG: DUF3466 family protein [Planctomycetota bacterium]|nr:DUF3466 family protein [Planctomycetota bacterium]
MVNVRSRGRAIAVALSCGGVCGLASAQEYQVVSAGPASWVSSRAFGINDRGLVVGGGLNSSAQSRAFAFSLQDGARMLPTDVSVAYAAQNDGTIIAQGLGSRSYIVTGTTLTPIPGLDGTFTNVFAFDINAAGVIVGSGREDNPPVETRAFSWDQTSTPVPLGTLGGLNSIAYGINDAGQIVGTSLDGASLPLPFLYGSGVLTDLSAGEGGAAYAINSFGQIAGNIGGEAFIRTGGTNQLLGSLGAEIESNAWAINDAGVAVGESDGRAFVYRAGTLVDLNTVIPANSGWVLEAARGINNYGEIAGIGRQGGRTRAFLLLPTCRADYNQDGQADFFDYLDFAIAFADEGPRADFNRDDQVDFFDFLDFVAELARCG